MEDLTALYGGTRFAAQELDGLLVENEGALWRAEDLAAVRGPLPPTFDRIVVAVDPPAGMDGAACGVVVAGRRGDRAWVIADASVERASPARWADAAVAAARAHKAAAIVAEANQGGAMVRASLVAAGAAMPVRLVHAREGKAARAAPVAALYERGRVTHVAAFPQLEEEMMALAAGDDGAGARDRVDALVWALTALMLEGGAAGPRIVRL